jgi:hypothetical protein
LYRLVVVDECHFDRPDTPICGRAPALPFADFSLGWVVVVHRFFALPWFLLGYLLDQKLVHPWRDFDAFLPDANDELIPV